MSSQAVGSTHLTPCPYQIVRPLGLGNNFTREVRLDYGALFITSVRFEHPSVSCPPGLQRTRNRPRRQNPGRHLLVSHMYSPTFLFDLNNVETKNEDYTANNTPVSISLF